MVDWLGRDATGEVCHQAFYDQGERCDWCVSEREEGDAWQWEVTGPKDGRTYRITSSPVRHGDGSYSRMILMHDITEMKEAERERLDLAARSQHAQKLESLGVLAGGIAHDFNNLLMGILGNASLALMDLEGDAQPARHVEQIQDAAQRAADLTRQMLAYSGKGRFIVEPIQLNTLIQDMDPLFRAAISSRIQLEYILSPELPPIEADASQIRQLMMNLVINAAEAIGPKSGSVTITTGNTYCSAETFAGVFPHEAPPPGKYVRIAVSDTGKGMDEETIARVFDPFFTTKFMGRGLGLAAAIGIVRGHRGAVSIKSAPQHGSTFIIYLPAFAENESEEPV
jgi:signal transduction histidine kinase